MSLHWTGIKHTHVLISGITSHLHACTNKHNVFYTLSYLKLMNFASLFGLTSELTGMHWLPRDQWVVFTTQLHKCVKSGLCNWMLFCVNCDLFYAIFDIYIRKLVLALYCLHLPLFNPAVCNPSEPALGLMIPTSDAQQFCNIASSVKS